MRYMLLMYRDEEQWEARPEAERDAIRQRAVEYSEGYPPRGFFQTGSPLFPTRTATTVRISHSRVVTTDGPFAETKEQLGGYSVVEAENLDAVIAFVARHPLVLLGGHSIEIRPMRERQPPR